MGGAPLARRPSIFLWQDWCASLVVLGTNSVGGVVIGIGVIDWLVGIRILVDLGCA